MTTALGDSWSFLGLAGKVRYRENRTFPPTAENGYT